LDDVRMQVQIELVTATAPKAATRTSTHKPSAAPFRAGVHYYTPYYARSSAAPQTFDAFIKQMLAMPATALAGAVAALLTAPLCFVSGMDLAMWLLYAPALSGLATLMTRVCMLGSNVLLSGGYLPGGPHFTFKGAAILGFVAAISQTIIHLAYMM